MEEKISEEKTSKEKVSEKFRELHQHLDVTSNTDSHLSVIWRVRSHLSGKTLFKWDDSVVDDWPEELTYTRTIGDIFIDGMKAALQLQQEVDEDEELENQLMESVIKDLESENELYKAAADAYFDFAQHTVKLVDHFNKDPYYQGEALKNDLEKYLKNLIDNLDKLNENK